MANEMRDRLVELVETAKKEWWEKSGRYQTSKAEADYIADHLIENGVVVPPVSLGQTIFILEDIGIQTLPEIVSLNVYRINFTISEDGLDCHIVCVTEIRSIQHIKGEDFGKTVFLTKEEAEQKLKEMRGVE